MMTSLRSPAVPAANKVALVVDRLGVVTVGVAPAKVTNHALPELGVPWGTVTFPLTFTVEPGATKGLFEATTVHVIVPEL